MIGVFSACLHLSPKNSGYASIVIFFYIYYPFDCYVDQEEEVPLWLRPDLSGPRCVSERRTHSSKMGANFLLGAF